MLDQCLRDTGVNIVVGHLISHSVGCTIRAPIRKDRPSRSRSPVMVGQAEEIIGPQSRLRRAHVPCRLQFHDRRRPYPIRSVVLRRIPGRSARMFSARRRGRARGGPRQRQLSIRPPCRSGAPTTKTDMNLVDASTTVARARSVASRSASCSKRSSIAYPEKAEFGKYRHGDRFFMARTCCIYYRGLIRGRDWPHWRRWCKPQRARSRDSRLREVHLPDHHLQLRGFIVSRCGSIISLIMPKLGYLGLRHQFNLF